MQVVLGMGVMAFSLNAARKLKMAIYAHNMHVKIACLAKSGNLRTSVV
jgi:hypothetical protein